MALVVPMLLMVYTSHLAAASTTTFASFATKYNKVYKNPEEASKREAIYKASLLEIESLQKQNPRAKFAANQHADLTPEEFRVRYGGGYVSPAAGLREESSGGDQKPIIQSLGALTAPRVDWREQKAVDPVVYDQGECGCCWAVSVAQTIGSQYFLKKNLSVVPSLSFQQLICCDCGGDDAGCHGGDPHLAYKYVESAGGLDSQEEYPFTDGGPNAQSCNTAGQCSGCTFNASSAVATISGWRDVTATDPASGNPGNETELAEVLAREGPLSVCIDSDPWRFYSGGILDYGARKLNHCVQLIGYDTQNSPPYWILKNSWGASWGEAGYIRMSMGMDICGVADVATIPLI